MRKKPYRVIGLGGTFDHFHAGHKAFLDFAGALGNKLVIGVTAEELIKEKKHRALIEPIRQRKHSVLNYCKQKKYPAEIITLYDVYGTTLDENAVFDALAVTEETLPGAKKINDTRVKMGLKDLPVHTCQLVYDLEKKAHIHAVRIRAGEISRRGEVYTALFTKSITLSDKQRAFFSKEQGTIIKSPESSSNNLRVVVGDKSIEHFNQLKCHYDIGIYDGHTGGETNKSAVSLAVTPDNRVDNPAGSITPQLSEAILARVQAKAGHILVTGEEDLATIAAVLHLPLQSEVYYGQPGKGLVQIIVTEGVKNTFYNTLATYAEQKQLTTG